MHAASSPSPLPSSPFSLESSKESDHVGGEDKSAVSRIIQALKEEGDDLVVDPSFRAALDLAPTLYEHMLRARIVSARMVALQRAERIGFHTSSMGEEA